MREFLETREPEAIVFATEHEGLPHIYETYLKRERLTLEAMGCVVGPAERIDPYVEYTRPADQALKLARQLSSQHLNRFVPADPRHRGAKFPVWPHLQRHIQHHREIPRSLQAEPHLRVARLLAK